MSSHGQRLGLRGAEFNDSMLNYCINRSNINISLSINAQVKAALQIPLQGQWHLLQPIDRVVKDCMRQNW